MARLAFIKTQIKQIETERLARLQQAAKSAAPQGAQAAAAQGPHTMVILLARIRGIGIETADLLVQEVLARNLRDRRAVARCGGLTGAPDESGSRRREQGL